MKTKINISLNVSVALKNNGPASGVGRTPFKGPDYQSASPIIEMLVI